MGSYRRLRLGWLLLLLAVLAMPEPGTVAAQPASLDFVPERILVKFHPGTSQAAIAEAHRSLGGALQSVIAGIDVQVVRVPGGQEQTLAQAYARSPNVLFAEPDGLYRAIGTPSDTQAGSQWQYDNTGQTGGTADADLDAFEAWDVTTGSGTVAIAILDTGIDQSHEDLAIKIAANVNFSSSPSVEDNYGHGTHVAGSAAAATNNALGVAGTCPDCVLFNVKVLSDDGSGSWSQIASGINWSADNGAKVISMSLGGWFGSSTVASAVNYAWSKGAILTAAAGNEGWNFPTYPAYYTNVIAVAATDHNDQKPTWSNYGSWVDVAAPGAAILSTAPDHPNTIWGSGVKYGTISGTSMATPHVAGVAGLVWSSGVCGTDNACVRSRIETYAEAISGTGSLWTHGRVNACQAVHGGACPEAAPEPTATSTATPASTATPTSTPEGPTPTPTPTPVGPTPTPTSTPTATPQPTATPVPATLVVLVTTDKASYVHREDAWILVIVSSGGSVPGAAVRAELVTAKGRVHTGNGTTDAIGGVAFLYRVNSKRDGVGTYSVTATASKDGFQSGSGSTSFQVTQ